MLLNPCVLGQDIIERDWVVLSRLGNLVAKGDKDMGDFEEPFARIGARHPVNVPRSTVWGSDYPAIASSRFICP